MCKDFLCNDPAAAVEDVYRFDVLLQLTHEDADIHDPACKCLSLLVQLFGGEHKDALSAENMVRVPKKKILYLTVIFKEWLSSDSVLNCYFQRVAQR